MKKEFLVKKIKHFFVLGFLVTFSGCKLLDLSILQNKDSAKNDLFSDPLDTKEKQQKELRVFLKEFKKKFKEGGFDHRIAGVGREISENEILAKKVSSKEDEKFYHDELAKLNERKQVLINIKDTRVASEEVIQNHIKIIAKEIDRLKKIKDYVEYKPFYSFSDFNEIQKTITTLEHKISAENSARDSLYQQKKTEAGTVVYWQKEIETKQKEQKKLVEEVVPIEKEQGLEAEKELKQKAKLLEKSIFLMNEKKELAEEIINKLNLEINYKDVELNVLERELLELNKGATLLNERLFIDQSDIKALEEDVAKEEKVISDVRNRSNRTKESKKTNKKNYQSRLVKLEKKRKLFKEVDPDRYFLDARYKKLEDIVLFLDRNLDYLDTKIELGDEKLNLKKLELKLTNIRRRLYLRDYDKGDIEKWSNEFYNASRREEEQIVALDGRKIEINNFIISTKLKIENIKATIEKFQEQKDLIFKDNEKAYKDSIDALEEAMTHVKKQSGMSLETSALISELIRFKVSIINQYQLILKTLGEKKLFDIWRRSSKAISWDNFVKSLNRIEHFAREFVWNLPLILNPISWFRFLKKLRLRDYIGWIILLACFVLYFLLLRFGVYFSRRKIGERLSRTHGLKQFLLSILYVVLDVVYKSYILFSVWLFILLDMTFNFKHFIGNAGRFLTYTDSAILKIYFFIFSIILLLYLSSKLVSGLKNINERMDYSFISKAFVEKYVLILKFLFYSSAILLPLQKAFSFFVDKSSRLPDVILGIYISVLEIIGIILFIVHKSDLLSLFKPKHAISKWFWHILDKYYYWILLFLMSLMILSNPYVGYRNLAFLLLHAVPLTILIFSGLFFLHFVIRKYSALWFIREEDDEVIDRFEHAKAYYGIFVILTFLLLIFVGIVLVAKIWGSTNPVELISGLLQNKWTIDIGEGYKFGFVQFFVLVLFIAGGFLTATLIDKFVLSKIFDVLRMDFGVRNTISSILRYIIIYIVIVIGLTAVNLGRYIGLISTAAILGIGFAFKDILVDLIAGFWILIERPIEIGSFIELDNIIGTVRKISPRATIVKSATQRTIIIPNKDLINKHIVNWNYGRTNVGFDIRISIHYADDPNLVKEILMKIVRSDNRILHSPAPVFRVDDFQKSGYEFLVRAFTSSRRVRDKWDIAASFRVNILKEFKENNITIPYPHTTLKFENKDGKIQSPIAINFDEK